MDREEGEVASALELVAIAELAGLLGSAGAEALGFSPREIAFARSKSDPARRLAARLAAKRAAARLLGGGVAPGDVEVVRQPGRPPRLELSQRAEARLRAAGASRALVSLTHGRTHAAASVVLARD